jgi:very-short-patch-repair endonuclease
LRDGTKLFRGVYFLPSEPDESPSLLDRARAALLVCPPGSAICGITALALTGLDLPRPFEDQARGPVHVLLPTRAQVGRVEPNRPELVLHRERSPRPTWRWERAGLLMARLDHCWAQVVARHLKGQVGPFLPAPDPALRGQFTSGARQAFLECVQLGDALVRRQDPLIKHDRFVAYIQGLSQLKGVRAARAAFRYVRPQTDSPNETWLRLIALDAGFPEPAINHRLQVRMRDRLLDLGWIDRMIALEYHGAQHFNDPIQARDDVSRRGQLQGLGWVVVEAVYRDLLQPADLIGRLTAAFAGRPAPDKRAAPGT